MFTVFRSAGSGSALVVLVVSIVVCTLDRTPRLWRGRVGGAGRPTRAVLRPAAAGPRGDARVAAAGLSRVVRGHGFRVREEVAPDGTRYVYGDRHQYTKLATLFTHLGLILFLVGGGRDHRGSATSRASSCPRASR